MHPGPSARTFSLSPATLPRPLVVAVPCPGEQRILLDVTDQGRHYLLCLSVCAAGHGPGQVALLPEPEDAQEQIAVLYAALQRLLGLRAAALEARDQADAALWDRTIEAVFSTRHEVIMASLHEGGRPSTSSAPPPAPIR